MPNLEWLPSLAPQPRDAHRVFYHRIYPLDNPFWRTNYPGNLWNCQCRYRNTDKPATHGKPKETVHPAKGLGENPGITGNVFTEDHPYIREVDKEAKEAVDGFLKRTLKEDVPPPETEKYREAVKGKVYTSPYHGENEVEENERLAKFITKHIDTKVWLLPRLDPSSSKELQLRPSLLPKGVKKNKNPDYYIGGQFFDAKSMMGVEKTADTDKQKRLMENRIKKAKEQADNIVLEVPEWVDMETIAKTVNNYLSRSSQERIILVYWNKRLLKFNSAKK